MSQLVFCGNSVAASAWLQVLLARTPQPNQTPITWELGTKDDVTKNTYQKSLSELLASTTRGGSGAVLVNPRDTDIREFWENINPSSLNYSPSTARAEKSLRITTVQAWGLAHYAREHFVDTGECRRRLRYYLRFAKNAQADTVVFPEPEWALESAQKVLRSVLGSQKIPLTLRSVWEKIPVEPKTKIVVRLSEPLLAQDLKWLEQDIGRKLSTEDKKLLVG